jgi:hypothetical protein
MKGVKTIASGKNWHGSMSTQFGQPIVNIFINCFRRVSQEPVD